MADGKNLFDQQVKNDKITYDRIYNIKLQALDVDPKAIQ